VSNIRLDLTITDTYAGTPTRKTASILMASGRPTAIRTENNLGGWVVKLNVDAHATVVPGMQGLIDVRVTFEYTPAQAEAGDAAARAARPAQLHEQLNVYLEADVGDHVLVHPQEHGQPVAAERIVPLGAAPPVQGAEVPGTPVVIEDDLLIEVLQVGAHPNTSRTRCSPRTSASISSRVL
jgi:hypothetical protein